jgi:hypothetical protein
MNLKKNIRVALKGLIEAVTTVYITGIVAAKPGKSRFTQLR